MYIVITMSKQISVSDEVYRELTEIKGEKSYSEVISGALNMRKEKKGDIETLRKFFGILKGDKKLAELDKIIAEERERNYGRKFDW